MRKWMPEEYLVTVPTYLAYFSFSSPHPGSESLISWTVWVRKCSRGFRVLESTTPPVVERLLCWVSLYPANMWGCSCSFRIPTPCLFPNAASKGGLEGKVLCHCCMPSWNYCCVITRQNRWVISDLPKTNLTWGHPDHQTIMCGVFFFMPTSM